MLRHIIVKKQKDTWVERKFCSDGGMCFFFFEDQTPPFASATMAAKDLEDARKREAKRDEKELTKRSF